jgi:carbon monoxide dehydrogenase subunit G
MKLSGERILPAPRQSVWELFDDPERLSRLIPGCEKLEQLAPDEFSGRINVGIASVKGTYTGRLRLDEIRPPEHYKMNVEGRGKHGFMRGARRPSVTSTATPTIAKPEAGWRCFR